MLIDVVVPLFCQINDFWEDETEDNEVDESDDEHRLWGYILYSTNGFTTNID